MYSLYKFDNYYCIFHEQIQMTVSHLMLTIRFLFITFLTIINVINTFLLTSSKKDEQNYQQYRITHKYQ